MSIGIEECLDSRSLLDHSHWIDTTSQRGATSEMLHGLSGLTSTYPKTIPVLLFKCHKMRNSRV